MRNYANGIEATVQHRPGNKPTAPRARRDADALVASVIVPGYMATYASALSLATLLTRRIAYSHSIFSSVLISIVSYAIIRWRFRNRNLALLFAIGVLSHVVLDVIFHEKDILLSPFSSGPVWGFGIIDFPVLNFILEFVYGVFCWWYFKGSKRLLTVIMVFNILDLPVMLASGKALDIFVKLPFLLPTFILLQITLTWYFVAKYSGDSAKLLMKAKMG